MHKIPRKGARHLGKIHSKFKLSLYGWIQELLLTKKTFLQELVLETFHIIQEMEKDKRNPIVYKTKNPRHPNSATKVKKLTKNEAIMTR